MQKTIQLKKRAAVKLAGSAAALARLLGLTQGAVSQWGVYVPELQMWRLKVLRPDWFDEEKK